MTRAREIEEVAALMVMRREGVDWTDRDEAALASWLGESVAHQAAYWRLEHGWRAADRISALGNEAVVSEHRARLRDFWWKPIAAAASLALVFGAFALQFPEIFSSHRATVQSARFSTEVGGYKLVRLPDGSKVELNTGTSLRAELGDGERRVWLERGEAYFEVAKAAGSPFVVQAGSRTITVLGTKFSIRRKENTVTVSVSEGRVRIEDARSQARLRSATIAAGDIAVAEGSATLLANSAERVEEQLAWRDGMLVFDGTTLEAAAAEFNRYNGKQIVIADAATGSIRIGGRFEAKNIEAFTRLLGNAYNLKVESGAGKISISS